MQAFSEFIRSLGAPRIAAMGAVTIALVGFFAFVILRVTAPQLTPLFTDLSFEDSSAIIKDLERQGIPYEMRNEGAIVMVPKELVPRLRMKLAEAGLPKGGGIGYEIFDKSDALGATSFVQNINHLRALEGELARTIRAIERVQAARVHLVLPERPLFSREKAEPTASIVLKVRGMLEAQQVRAIRHLVASAVNGLKPERVSIVDEAGRLLADGAATDDAAGIGADERKTTFERRLREQVEGIVTSVVGPGRARVQLTADFDLNRITQTSDRFDPEGRVVRSSQTREESSSTSDGKEGQVTVANELPNAQRGGEATPATPRDQNRKSEEIVNYEISRTTKTEVIESGRVNRISVAVLVDGVYNKNDKGEVVYQPREKEEIDRIAALVRSAIGFDQKRGDQVEVVNLRFADAPSIAMPEPAGWMSMFQFTKEDILRAIELAVMGLAGPGRPAAWWCGRWCAVCYPPNSRPSSANAALLAAAVAGAAAAGSPLTPEVQAAIAQVDTEDLKGVPSHTAKMIDIAQVQGQVHAQSVQKVGELADKNPNETVSILRQWLHDSAA